MLKQAWRSYLSSLHPRNIKKLRESTTYAWFWITFFCIYASTALLLDNGYADLYCSVFLRLLLPLGLMGYSNLTSRYLMPKAMFLCPMKEEDRKEYINCVISIKIGAMVISSLGAELIWSMFFGFRLWEVVLVPFLIFLIGIADYAGYEVKRNEVGQLPDVVFDKEGNKVRIWMNTMIVAIVLFAVAALVGYDMELLDEVSNKIDLQMYLGFVGICVLLAILFAYRVAKDQYRYVIEQSSDYELHFKILGKVESPKKYKLSLNKR